MSNFTTNTYTMKREILNFSNKLSKDLTRPKKKFVADMTYGMLASNSAFFQMLQMPWLGMALQAQIQKMLIEKDIKLPKPVL